MITKYGAVRSQFIQIITVTLGLPSTELSSRSLFTRPPVDGKFMEIVIKSPFSPPVGDTESTLGVAISLYVRFIESYLSPFEVTVTRADPAKWAGSVHQIWGKN